MQMLLLSAIKIQHGADGSLSDQDALFQPIQIGEPA